MAEAQKINTFTVEVDEIIFSHARIEDVNEGEMVNMEYVRYIATTDGKIYGVKDVYITPNVFLMMHEAVNTPKTELIITELNGSMAIISGVKLADGRAESINDDPDFDIYKLDDTKVTRMLWWAGMFICLVLAVFMVSDGSPNLAKIFAACSICCGFMGFVFSLIKGQLKKALKSMDDALAANGLTTKDAQSEASQLRDEF
ncbi:hypothetical protein VCHA53O466_320009 [Vibrio chagasii]|nr:hypothetical protein VCHA53O466_320009 [Vibrio chagasii]